MPPKPESRRRVLGWVTPGAFGWVFDTVDEVLAEAARSPTASTTISTAPLPDLEGRMKPGLQALAHSGSDDE
jgi:hypothetical protein